MRELADIFVATHDELIVVELFSKPTYPSAAICREADVILLNTFSNVYIYVRDHPDSSQPLDRQCNTSLILLFRPFKAIDAAHNARVYIDI